MFNFSQIHQALFKFLHYLVYPNSLLHLLIANPTITNSSFFIHSTIKTTLTTNLQNLNPKKYLGLKVLSLVRRDELDSDLVREWEVRGRWQKCSFVLFVLHCFYPFLHSLWFWKIGRLIKIMVVLWFFNEDSGKLEDQWR